MNIELLEIQDFLAAHPPFDELPGDVLLQTTKALSIRYLRRGASFPPPNESRFCYLIRQGLIDLHDQHERLIEKISEGDLFIAACGQSTTITGVASEDSLLYQLPCDVFHKLKNDYPAFDAHFSAVLKQNYYQQPEEIKPVELEVAVKQLVKEKPVSISPQHSILDAAQLMFDKHLACLPVVSADQLVGVVTDRDISRRCVIEQRSRQSPLDEIMTQNPYTVRADQSVIEALMQMTQHNVRHLPVMEDGQLIGMISSNDLLRLHTTTATKLVRMLHLANDVDELATLSQKIPALQQQLVNTNMTCYRVGQIISSVADALTQRLIHFAEQALGPAPIDYAWLAVGSLARQELSAHSDQDNALLLSDDYDASQHGNYFESLARRVNDGLDACGFYYCPGDVMASNLQWRQPLNVWKEYFTHWIKTPTPKDIMLACNFFDLRVVAGKTSLLDDLMDPAIEMAKNDHIFLAHLAADALRNRPPLGFFRQFVLVNDKEHHDSFDIKLGGVLPITTLARLFALTAGSRQVNTFERLQDASRTSALSQEGATDLSDALKFINTLRLRHQIRQHNKHQVMDNFIPPLELSHLERQALKEAFAVINDMHKTLQLRYQMDR